MKATKSLSQKDLQKLIDEKWLRTRGAPVAPKIICSICHRGPLDGRLLRKIGPRWWICQGATCTQQS